MCLEEVVTGSMVCYALFRQLEKEKFMEKICERFEIWFDKNGLLAQLTIWGLVPFGTLPTCYLDYKRGGFRKSWFVLLAHTLAEFNKMLIAFLIYAVTQGYIKL